MKLGIALCSFFFLSITTGYADLYQWTDQKGVIHVVDDAGSIPEAYRDKVKVHRTAQPTQASTSFLAPSRTYPEKSQGAFAQKLALDLGLIKNSAEDALGPLGAAGIQPAGGWRVYEALTTEAQTEVIAAARRAAESQRILVSADGAEAIVRQAATPFLPPPVVHAQAPPVEPYAQEPEIIIEQQPPQIIEVIREPVYIPQPVIVGNPYWRRHPRRRPHRPRQAPPEHRSRLAPGFSTPAPTHMPFGASHMPFGASHMPFEASHMPFGSSRAPR